MPTVLECFDDAYRLQTEAIVLSARGNRITFDRTVFYPGFGAAPSDIGEIILPDGRRMQVSGCEWDSASAEVHHCICKTSQVALAPGDKVIAQIAWLPRHSAMRIHTALHLVSIAFPFPVVQHTILPRGGNITFRVADTGIEPRELERLVNEIVKADFSLETVWIAQEEVMHSISWPTSNGRIRAIKIDEIDLQPCDGLHVRRTAEVGPVQIRDIISTPDQMLLCDVCLI